MPSCSAVLLSDGGGRRLFQRVRGLRQGDDELQIVLVHSGGPDELSRQVIDSLSQEPGVRVARPTGASTPGALRNAGVTAATGEAIFFLDEGYQLEAGYWDKATKELMAKPDVAFVTSWLRRQSPSGEHSVAVPASCDLSALLSDPETLHPATVFRRSLWHRLGDFDEELAGLELYDFWVRALDRGAQGTILEESLVTHATADSAYRRDLERDLYLPAITAVFKKHRDLFESAPAAVLVAREKAIYDLDAHYRPILKRRAEAVEELDELNREIGELTRLLRETGRDRIDWGDLRRTTPISPEWGSDRGRPVDRYYIEDFLSSHADDIRGTVLEVQEADYTRLFGGEAVVHSDVVDLDPTNPRATLLADLRRAAEIPDATYDCFILTQTLHVIDDMRAVVQQCARILKPGGVLLMTFPCLSRVCLEYGPDGDFWRLTEAGVRNLLYEFFPPSAVETRGYGNVLVATAFLYGLSCEELTEEEFDAYDPFHPVLIGARAVKSLQAVGTRGAPATVRRSSATPRAALILGYHRVASCSPDPHGLCVPVDEFRSHMAHLGRHCRPLPLEELVSLAEARELPPGAVAVTFDDGYVDALTTASPILSELGIPATFFVSTEGIEGVPGFRFWWDALGDFFGGLHDLPTRLDLELNGSAREFPTASQDERQATHDALYQDLLRLQPAQRDAVLRHLGRWSGLGLEPAADQRPMNRGELLRLAARDGHTIGAHTVHHLALSRQPFDTQRREIMESKAALERLLDRPVISFAYPYGDFGAETVDLVRAGSFRVAVTCEERLLGERCDPLRLPRWMVPQQPGNQAHGHFPQWLRTCFETATDTGARADDP